MAIFFSKYSDIRHRIRNCRQYHRYSPAREISAIKFRYKTGELPKIRSLSYRYGISVILQKYL